MELFLNAYHLPNWNPEDTNNLNIPITRNEIDTATKKLYKEIHGFKAGLYQTF